MKNSKQLRKDYNTLQQLIQLNIALIADNTRQIINLLGKEQTTDTKKSIKKMVTENEQLLEVNHISISMQNLMMEELNNHSTPMKKEEPSTNFQSNNRELLQDLLEKNEKLENYEMCVLIRDELKKRDAQEYHLLTLHR